MPELTDRQYEDKAALEISEKYHVPVSHIRYEIDEQIQYADGKMSYRETLQYAVRAVDNTYREEQQQETQKQSQGYKIG